MRSEADISIGLFLHYTCNVLGVFYIQSILPVVLVLCEMLLNFNSFKRDVRGCVNRTKGNWAYDDGQSGNQAYDRAYVGNWAYDDGRRGNQAYDGNNAEENEIVI